MGRRRSDCLTGISSPTLAPGVGVTWPDLHMAMASQIRHSEYEHIRVCAEPELIQLFERDRANRRHRAH